MPSLVVPPWMSSTSLYRASRKRCHDWSRSRRAWIHEWTTRLSVEPCDGAGLVVLDAAGDELVVVVVSEPLEQLGELVGREQVEEHHHVGLLGELVAVRAVALGLEDAIEALDVAVLLR